MIEALNKMIIKLEQLSESQQEEFAQEMLNKLDDLTTLPEEIKEEKLSEALLLPELAEDEDLFQRNQDTGREIVL